MNDPVFLRPNTTIKPALNHWLMWPPLLPPPWAALIVAKKHVPIMDSYIESPDLHANAAKTPSLMGGPWVDYPTHRVAEIRELLEETKRVQAPMLELAKAIQELDDLLRGEAKGLSLEAMYARVPATLRGYVELVYDLDSRPGARYFEGLLYRSAFYQRHLQQVVLKTIDKDWLPYERSTPVLPDDENLLLSLPFDDERLDLLLAMERVPQPLARAMEAAGVKEADRARFASYFTPEAPASRHVPPADDQVRVRYLGHACVLVETRDVSVLLDPFLSYEYPATLPRYTFQDLPDKIDYALVTHAHNDHFRPETLLRLRSRIQNVVVPRSGARRRQDPSLKLALEHFGFRRVLELHELDAIEVPGGRITAVPFLGEHSDVDIQGKTGYHIALGGRAVLGLADSANLDPLLYRNLRAVLGEVDILFLGMECEGSPLSWYYGTLLTQKLDRAADQSRRDKGSNADQAIALVEEWCPAQAYVYAMGQEPWLNHVLAIKQGGDHLGIKESDRFVAHCRGRGIEAERLFGRKEIVLPARR